MRDKLRRIVFLLAITALLVLPVTSSPVVQGQELTRTERRIHHELVMLPRYNVFDNLQFRVDGSTAILTGQVTRPTLKS